MKTNVQIAACKDDEVTGKTSLLISLFLREPSNSKESKDVSIELASYYKGNVNFFLFGGSGNISVCKNYLCGPVGGLKSGELCGAALFVL